MSATQVDLSLAKPGDACVTHCGDVHAFVDDRGKPDDDFRFRLSDGQSRNRFGRLHHTLQSPHDIVRVTRDGNVITPAPAYPNAGPGRLIKAAEAMLRFIEAGHAGACHALDLVYCSLRDAVSAEKVTPAPAKPAEEVGDAPAAVISGPEWRPIETAPKDGTKIVVLDESGCPDIVRWSAFGLTGTPKWRTRASHPIEPTHWMPLPESPRVQPAAE